MNMDLHTIVYLQKSLKSCRKLTFHRVSVWSGAGSVLEHLSFKPHFRHSAGGTDSVWRLLSLFQMLRIGENQNDLTLGQHMKRNIPNHLEMRKYH